MISCPSDGIRFDLLSLDLFIWGVLWPILKFSMLLFHSSPPLQWLMTVACNKLQSDTCLSAIIIAFQMRQIYSYFHLAMVL